MDSAHIVKREKFHSINRPVPSAIERSILKLSIGGKLKKSLTLAVIIMSTLVWGTPHQQVTVSILPMQSMVQELAGPQVTVHVMIPPGASPEQFEPSPSQIKSLSQSLIFFSVGADLEKSWLPRIRKQMKGLRIVDVGTPFAQRSFLPSEKEKHHDRHHGHHHSGHKDPHLWTDPIMLIKMSEMVAVELKKFFPNDSAAIESRLEQFREKMNNVDQQISQLLKDHRGEVLLVFHPAWGYFADRYGLHQMAIEQAGRSPGPRMLAATIAKAKEVGAKAIFVQAQMNQSVAQAIAQELKIPVIEIDPLAYAPERSLLEAAQKIAQHLDKRSP